MTALPQLTNLPIVLAIVSLVVAGIYWSCRGQGICSNEYIREAVIWGGGFLIYAVLDYYILMR